MPKCGLLNSRFKNWSAERIYAELAKQPTKQPQPGQGEGEDGGQPGDEPSQGGGSGTKQGDPGQCGQVLDGGATPEQLRKQERVWQQRVRQALNNAVKSGGAGAIPGSMQEVLKRLKGGGEDWRHVLRNFVDPSSRQDYAWSRPDRRFVGMPFILPGTVSCGINHIVMVRDVSGSIDTEKCSAFTLEGQAMLDQDLIDKLTIIDCDTQIQRVDEYVPGDILPLDVKGRGGTKFQPVWDWVEACTDDISALVYFTDLEPNGGNFGNEPRVPVLWACQNEDTNRKPPFGDLTVIGS
jgi:predicted metal-dependent peptidase